MVLPVFACSRYKESNSSNINRSCSIPRRMRVRVRARQTAIITSKPNAHFSSQFKRQLLVVSISQTSRSRQHREITGMSEHVWSVGEGGRNRGAVVTVGPWRLDEPTTARRVINHTPYTLRPQSLSS